MVFFTIDNDDFFVLGNLYQTTDLVYFSEVAEGSKRWHFDTPGHANSDVND